MESSKEESSKEKPRDLWNKDFDLRKYQVEQLVKAIHIIYHL
jgi:hypothetical protein